ncbi:MAG TPA: carbohydrate kinase family protein [Thermomicrobiales bacterium]|nr:carbohydrate kinase family protein [Thermomicrobiales bacterium]
MSERRWDILGVGDADVDLFLRTPRLPGRDDKVLGELVGECAGGMVANFCYSAARMGSRVGLASVVGADRYGEMALAGLRAAGVDLGPVVVKPGGRTYFCVVLLDDSGEKALTVVKTDCLAPGREDVDPASFGEARLVHLIAGDQDFTFWAAREAKRRGALVSLDIEPTSWGDRPAQLAALLARVDLAFPNAAGLRQIAGNDPLAGARLLLGLGPRVAVVTMGARGCLAVTADEAVAIPARRVPVVDTTGAGDCFNGAFVSGFLKGWDVRRCGELATAAAALSVTRVGAQSGVPTLAEAEAFAARGDPAPAMEE